MNLVCAQHFVLDLDQKGYGKSVKRYITYDAGSNSRITANELSASIMIIAKNIRLRFSNFRPDAFSICTSIQSEPR